MPAGKSAIIYDHYGYQSEIRLVIFFLTFATLLGVASFVSDVFNYLEFSTYTSHLDLGLIGLNDMTTTFFAFIIVAGVVYGLEVIFMLVAFFGRWHRSSNGRQAIMWTREVLSIVDAILCDLSILVLYYLSFAVGYCPMLQQMRTVRGKVAVSLTACHAVFSILQSVYYRKVVGRYPSNCERLLKKFCWMLHVFIASIAVFALVAAFIYDPIHTSMTRKQFQKWGIGQAHSAPIYFVQDLSVADVINKQYNAAMIDLHENETTNGTLFAFDQRLDKLLKCNGLRTAFHFCDIEDIMETETGVLKAFKCDAILAAFEHVIEDRHKTYLDQASCSIIAKAKYDFQSSLVTYSLGYEIRPINKADECYGGYLKVTDPGTVSDASYDIPLSPFSRRDINQLIIGDICSTSGCYANDTSTMENIFSCLDNNCVRYNTSDENISVKASPFRFAWSVPSTTYNSDLDSLRSLVQCSVGIQVNNTDLQLCKNETEQYSHGEKLTENCT